MRGESVEGPAAAAEASAARVFLFLLPGGRPRLRLGGGSGWVPTDRKIKGLGEYGACPMRMQNGTELEVNGPVSAPPALSSISSTLGSSLAALVSSGESDMGGGSD